MICEDCHKTSCGELDETQSRCCKCLAAFDDELCEGCSGLDNVIPIGGRRKKISFERNKSISFKEIPTGIRVRVSEGIHIEDLIRLATDADGWTDVVQLCSAFVVRTARVVGWSQEMLDESARVLNGNLTLYGFDVRVGFELTGPEAVRINVLTRRTTEGGI